jgi:predicted nuclease with TOPRIM domain
MQNILIGVLTLLVGLLGVLYFVEKKKNIQQVEVNVDLTNTRDSLENRLVDMISEYESLKTNNQEINTQLLGEKERVKELLTRLRNERSYSHSKFAEYEKELGTLRKIMRSYIVQIDSLNQSNIALRSENRDVKRKMQEVETERKEISKKFEEASEKVDIASVLRPINIAAEGLSKRGRDVSRARNVEKIKVCFTLDKNPIAKPGNRFIYVRVVRPDNLAVENTQRDTLFIGQEPVVYSARREVDYQNEALDVCIFVDIANEIPKGNYRLELFADNRHIGNGSVSFK